MTLRTKKKLFHLLNERARRKDWEEGKGRLREDELYYEWSNDPRKNRGHDMTRNYPLIEDE